ncbi:MAG: hypothetical protein K0M50_12875 [Prolixibacteraceae bacterium]|nr:hypothetical protein [Prolixibacteraceae bacterium]
MKLRIIYLGAFVVFGLNAFSQTLTKQWTTTDGLKTPESVLYDAGSNSIFVSNINGQASEKDGNGFISILGIDGKMKNLNWVTGLNAPKGLAIYNGNLYVADIDELVVINIKEARITDKIKLENAKFLNDVTASEDGTIFVTDMRDNKIYVLENGKLTLWLEDQLISNPNGLWAENGKLYIGTGQILQADIKTKEIQVLVNDCGGIDGIEKLKDGNFIYSNWKGLIFITKGVKSIQLLDTVDKQNTADIDFVPEKNIVLVPTFLANSVEAYLLKP